MSINHSKGIDRRKTKHLGRYFSSIDFELPRSISLENVKKSSNSKNYIVGDFIIGGKPYTLTLAEIDRIQETMVNAKETFQKRLNAGLTSR